MQGREQQRAREVMEGVVGERDRERTERKRERGEESYQVLIDFLRL